MSDGKAAIGWQKRRSEIAADVRSLFLKKPWPTVSIEEIAGQLGISYWQVYHSFDGQEDVYRAAVSLLVDSVACEIEISPSPQRSIRRTVNEFVWFAGSIINSERYRQLLFLMIRDAASDPWIAQIYETKIAAPLRDNLDRSVAKAGDISHTKVILLHGTCERAIAKLEARLALPGMHCNAAYIDTDLEKAVSEVCKEVIASACTFDGFSETKSLGRDQVQRQRL